MLSLLENFIFALDWGIYNYNTGTISLAFNVISVLIYATRSGQFFSAVFLAVFRQFYNF